jgi:hypothetical protein
MIQESDFVPQQALDLQRGINVKIWERILASLPPRVYRSFNFRGPGKSVTR